MPPSARAYFVTFRTYGTWLPGDGRHSVHRQHSHGYASPPVAPSGPLRNVSHRSMEDRAVLFGAEARATVSATVREVCDHRGWHLYAINARTNHAHVVVAASCSPEEVMTTFKAWCTRRLREARYVAADARVWARHGSTRYLWSDEDVEGAVLYVLEGQ